MAGIAGVAQLALAPGNTPLGAVLSYLALINVMVGGIYLLPGFPLDGGRVLRSGIWAATGSLRHATQIASYAGQAFGFLLIFWGVEQTFGGDFLGGIGIAFIGWLLHSAADATHGKRSDSPLPPGSAGTTACVPRRTAPDPMPVGREHGVEP